MRGSDESWRVARAPELLKPASRRLSAVGFSEKVDLTTARQDWTKPGFADGEWQHARPVSDRWYSQLIPRPIPVLRFEDWRPAGIRRSGTVSIPDGVWGLAFDQCEGLPRGSQAVFGTYLHSDRDREVTLAFGCDYWAAVRPNSELVWDQGRPDAGFREGLWQARGA